MVHCGPITWVFMPQTFKAHWASPCLQFRLLLCTLQACVSSMDQSLHHKWPTKEFLGLSGVVLRVCIFYLQAARVPVEEDSSWAQAKVASLKQEAAVPADVGTEVPPTPLHMPVEVRFLALCSCIFRYMLLADGHLVRGQVLGSKVDRVWLYCQLQVDESHPHAPVPSKTLPAAAPQSPGCTPYHRLCGGH